MLGLPDFAIERKGYNRTELEAHIDENMRGYGQALGCAALVCEWYDDGSCAINCDPKKWLAKHRYAKSLHKIQTDILDPETRC